MTRLSTGLRINSGKDDPSGMIAAAIQTNDIASMKTAITNTQNGSQMIATADSALGQITNLLANIRSLVTQVGNTAVVDSDMIAANQLQVDSAIQAIDRISQVTTFQGQKLLGRQPRLHQHLPNAFRKSKTWKLTPRTSAPPAS